MIFGYKCPVCKQEYISRERCDRLPRPCVECNHPGPLHRDFSGISVKKPMPEHYNASVQAYVSSERQFRNLLKVREAEASAYDGLDHDFQPIDLDDPAAVGVNGVGLEDTQRAREREGKKLIDLDKYFG